MSLIAGIKYKNEGCIISDFRLTNAFDSSQVDVANKFVVIDNRLIIFITGEVSVIHEIKTLINDFVEFITHENIDNDDGIFISTIKSALDDYCDTNSNISLLCVHLDKISNAFKMFTIRFSNKNGYWKHLLKSDSTFTWDVIGSGAIVAQQDFYPNRVPFSLKDIFKVSKERGYDISTATHAVENEIIDRLNSHGAATYKKLGVSPVFNIVHISNSCLRIIGRDVKRKKVEVGEINKEFQYSFTKATGDGAVLINIKTGECGQVNSFEEGIPRELVKSQVIFDPLELEGDEFKYPKYIITQDCSSYFNDKTIVVRSIYKSNYKIWNGSEYLVKELIHADAKEFNCDIDVKKIALYSIANKSSDEEFEASLKRETLFDEEWLNNNLCKNHPFNL